MLSCYSTNLMSMYIPLGGMAKNLEETKSIQEHSSPQLRPFELSPGKKVHRPTDRGNQLTFPAFKDQTKGRTNPRAETNKTKVQADNKKRKALTSNMVLPPPCDPLAGHTILHPAWFN